MVIYIEDLETFNQFNLEFNENESRIFIQLSDSEKHALNNRISFVVININQTFYVINLNHIDGITMKIEVLEYIKQSKNKVYLSNAKSVSHLLKIDNVIDSDLYRFIVSSEIDEEPFRGIQSFYNRTMSDLCKANINDSIPIVKQVEIIKKLLSYNLEKTDEIELKNFLSDSLYTFGWIEEAGIKIDPSYVLLLGNREHITNDYFVYSEYNFRTSTLRPSNRHGGINFTSLSKDSGIRKAFVSRFDNGKLISIDYSAYHPHLLIELCKKYIKDIDEDSLNWKKTHMDFYEWVAEMLGLEDTEESREDAKIMVFQSIYGGVKVELQNTPFFREVHKLTMGFKRFFDMHGFVETPFYKIRIRKDKFGEEQPSAAKVINYIIQAYETERNIQIIKKIKKKYKGKGKLIMYNYDAFVFDVPNHEVQYLYEKIYEQIIDSKEFPAKLVIGDNYDFK